MKSTTTGTTSPAPCSWQAREHPLRATRCLGRLVLGPPTRRHPPLRVPGANARDPLGESQARQVTNTAAAQPNTRETAAIRIATPRAQGLPGYIVGVGQRLSRTRVGTPPDGVAVGCCTDLLGVVRRQRTLLDSEYVRVGLIRRHPLSGMRYLLNIIMRTVRVGVQRYWPLPGPRTVRHTARVDGVIGCRVGDTGILVIARSRRSCGSPAAARIDRVIRGRVRGA